MGGFLDKPKKIKQNESGEGNKLLFGVSSMQGWRCTMEDFYMARANLGEGLEDWSFFAVFDGHSGHRISQHCSMHLLYNIVFTPEFESGDYVKGIRAGFLKIDEEMRKTYGFYGERSGGTTAVCAFVSPTHLYIANCGDSRAVLCRQGTPVFVTKDHKPFLPEEKERIHNAGGNVMIKRVNGTLAVSRALGDYDFKRNRGKGQCDQLISPEPEIFCQSRQETDEFLVLACDGIWDVMSNEDVCSFILSRLKITNNLVSIANDVLDTCLYKGSRDNMSIIIITFPGAPEPCEEAIEAEKRLDEELERITREKMNETEIYEDLLKVLKDVEIEGLPPGGGIHSKYDFIKQIYYEELRPTTSNYDPSWLEDLA